MVKYLPDVIDGLWVTLALAGSVIVTGVLVGLALSPAIFSNPMG